MNALHAHRQNKRDCPTSPSLVVGLIGGIGSGKSAVAAELARRGARVIAADQLGHEALRQPDIREEVVRLWGADVLDAEGQIDRRKLARIVFASDEERHRLEALTHPYIRRRLKEEVELARNEGIRLIVVDAAVLLEAGWHEICDQLVYVSAPLEVRLERVTKARGWAAKDWENREAAQLPLTEKHARADHVVDNSSTLQHLNHQVDDLMHRWGLGTPCAPETETSCPPEEPP